MQPGGSPAPPQNASRKSARIEVDSLHLLIDALRTQGYTVIAPVLREGVICLDEVSNVSDLPAGVCDEQAPGHYRAVKRNDDELFAHTVGPHAWKRYLQPPLRRLWQARRTNGSFELVLEEQETPRYAFLGVRPCDLRAIELLDRIYLREQYGDPWYRALRSALVVIAVNCLHPGGTCFCASVGSGPRATGGYDLALTEVVEGQSHYFVADVGSDHGEALLANLPQRAATPAELQLVERLLADATKHMGRRLDTDGLHDLLLHNLEHHHWEETAQRCLTCGNCTMVCPTCFCATVQDSTSLDGQQSERWRRSDSCFSIEFSHIFGGSIRQSPQSRYRQWMVHKLATWSDQFDALGCVGCGRCITWCPVGIDITAEARVFRRAGARRSPKVEPAQSVPASAEVG